MTATNQFGTTLLGGGEGASVKPGNAPVKRLLINPKNAAQWALYYPTTVCAQDFSEFVTDPYQKGRQGISLLNEGKLDEAWNAFSGTHWSDNFGRALIGFLKNDTEVVTKNIVPTISSGTVSVLLLQGAISLSRGQLGAMEEFHSAAQSALPSLNKDLRTPLEQLLLSQKAVALLVGGETKDARYQIEKAKALGAYSTTVAAAESYIAQAELDLDRAQKIVYDALANYPTSSTLRARAAELELSFGDSEAALREADEAIRLNHFDAYAHTIKGFAELARFSATDAESSFHKALSLGSAAGLPYLGLGLTKIRGGELTEGRELIQKAVHLERNVSLYRSYLGKAFFEEEEDVLARKEFDRATQLDPTDPTPYLYRAYERLSSHAPLEALGDIERSIELNDNRAVYRSRLLIDQDSGVRSSSLAEVFNAVGFSEVSRIEAIKSLGKGYANYSAHLLLSDSYDSNDDYFQAGISEFLIARLLSPVSFNLVRPNQSGSVGLNEYTALFDRELNRFSIDSEGNTRNESFDGAVAVSGTEGRWGYALTYDGNHTDGYRTNDYSREQVLYGSLQYQITPEDTLLLDTNVDIYDAGDPDVGYDPHSEDPDQDQEFDDYFVRFGFNHTFGPSNHLIGQVLYVDSSLKITDPTFFRPLVVSTAVDEVVVSSDVFLTEADNRISFDSHGFRYDLQHIIDTPIFSNILGGGVLDSHHDQRDEAATVLFDDAPPVELRSDADNNEGSRRLFNYTTFHVTPWLDIQGGLSYAHLHMSGAPLSVPFSDSVRSTTEVDPKAGFTLQVTPETTVRGAYFETVGTSGIREFELIEPTVVSGFNQVFFDLYPGTEAKNYGLGIDHKWPSSTYIGIEALDRDLTRPTPQTYDSLFLDAETGELIATDIILDESETELDERIVKSYLYQVLGKRVSATVDYAWTEDTDETLDTTAETNRVRFALNYFRTDGIFGFISGTWRGQELSGFAESYEDIPDGYESFWLLDAGLGYRFDNRHGQIALTINNILDEEYRYLPNGVDPVFFPGIGAGIRFSYNF